MKNISQITPQIFRQIESHLKKENRDSDKSSFSEVKKNLQNPKKLNPVQFVEEIIYVILASGFNQTTAKKYFHFIMEYLKNHERPTPQNLLKIFHNQNKIKAILKIWENKQKLCREFYLLKTPQEKIDFLCTLPHIGEITKYHLARNLGLDVVKYDIWIQRLGVCLYGCQTDIRKINNAKLSPEIQKLCDTMFDELTQILNEQRGYIDVVLWKACQQNILQINKSILLLNL